MSTALVDPAALAAVRCALAVVAEARGLDVDVDAATRDLDAVRDMLRTLARSDALRARVRTQVPCPVTDPDPAVAAAAVQAELDAIRARSDAARRQARAARRGTPEQRRIQRLEADLARVRTERDKARARAQDADQVIADLREQVADLRAALTEATDLADAAQEAARAARVAATDPRTLARDLLAQLRQNPALLDAAALAAPPDVRTAVLGALPDVLGELANPVTARAHAAARALSVTPLGGATEVGGSCMLVAAGTTRVLVDAGRRTGAGDPAPPGLAAVLDEGPVDAVVLTHAHNDHTGWVPVVVDRCPGVPVYATAPTCDLLPVMWEDTVKVVAGDPSPPYGSVQVAAALAATRPVRLGSPVRVGDLSFDLFDAGHVLGAAGVHLTDGTHRVVISGDVSGPGQATVGGWALPEDARYPDLLVLESTYGAAGPTAARTSTVAALVRDVGQVLDRGGQVLVPAFAVGRAQEVALALAEHLPGAQVLLDGLAIAVTDVYERHTGPTGRPIQVWSDTVAPVPRASRYDLIRRPRPRVVVASSGMLAGGPAVAWARALLPDPVNMVAFVGYQAPGSTGAAVQRAAADEDVVRLPTFGGAGQEVVVSAQVRTYSLGAHADADQLVAIATHARAAATMLVHGDPAARAALTERLRLRHLTVTDPGPWRAGA